MCEAEKIICPECGEVLAMKHEDGTFSVAMSFGGCKTHLEGFCIAMGAVVGGEEE